MTLAELKRKYRRHLLGLASALVVDSPTVAVNLGDRQRMLDARAARVESLEELGRDIDKTLDALLKDMTELVTPPAPPAQPNGESSNERPASGQQRNGAGRQPVAPSRADAPANGNGNGPHKPR